VQAIKPIIWDGEILQLLDQRMLPEEEIYIQCRSVSDVVGSIKDMVVRGAPAIGVAAAFAMVLAARQITCADAGEEAAPVSSDGLLEHLEEAAAYLKESRPTAVNLSWGVDRMLGLTRRLRDASPDKILKEMNIEAENIFREDIDCNKKIGDWGAQLIRNGSTVLTHCNAGALATAGYGTALGVVRSAFFGGKKIAVFANETRPFLQGARLTAWELQKEGIPVTLIVDGAAGYFISSGAVDCIVVGADRIAENGDTANKIGTYMLAVLARENSIPFYVAAPSSTIDISVSSGEDIVVEERSADEVTAVRGTSLAPAGIEVKNPSFDITPSRLITALITEHGITFFPTREKIRQLVREMKGTKDILPK